MVSDGLKITHIYIGNILSLEWIKVKYESDNILLLKKPFPLSFSSLVEQRAKIIKQLIKNPRKIYVKFDQHN